MLSFWKTDRNHSKSLTFPDHVDAYIEKERSLGAVIGPFHESPFDHACHISALNTAEKRL